MEKTGGGPPPVFSFGKGEGFLKGKMCIRDSGESDRMGHGPGITTILSSRKPIIEGVLDESANLATYFGAK